MPSYGTVESTMTISFNLSTHVTYKFSGSIQNKGIPPKYKQQRKHLPGHIERAVEPCPNHFQGLVPGAMNFIEDHSKLLSDTSSSFHDNITCNCIHNIHF